jgi:hypothetical protein
MFLEARRDVIDRLARQRDHSALARPKTSAAAYVLRQVKK